ncbi:hypothetical protein Psch_03844 [Pelotomaculum schinkii]|uniref:Uncharacterized protein n=1 Tax=Pelotomaculum schinkii TaxID=78350 RepID=A0A4Y7R8V2_9FIRM|nr:MULTISPECIES: hypothetical protein [Pelotomaculum]TEB05081.1 hypothetical protein Psch_03844 [Pelotomaculum schinkii]TEB14319.1 hypothetical protein Psfp_02995 [Pelotomaculum sp. FP]
MVLGILPCQGASNVGVMTGKVRGMGYVQDEVGKMDILPFNILEQQ